MSELTILRKIQKSSGRQGRLPRLIVVRDSGIAVGFKTTFEVFTRIGPDNSLERLTERSVGLVTDRPRDVYELFITLFEYVFITGRKQERLDKAVKLIGRNVTGIRGDAANLDDLDRLFETVRQEKGKVDVLLG